jgi:hypothetical protein
VSESKDVSRRRVLTGAGIALAGGVGLAAAGPVVTAAAGDGRAVGTGPEGTTTVEFRGRISQTGASGETFTSYGYLTRASGTDPADLFSGTPQSESTALLTAYATGALTARLFDQAVHQLDIAGELTVYQREQPGATFADPSSFQVGRPVAVFSVVLQDVLTVFAPARGLPTLTGDMRQRVSRGLRGPLAGKAFGDDGLRLRFFATGLGQLLDASTSNSFLEIAGNWSVE